MSYVVTKRIETEKCPPRRVDEIVHLPLGEAYDISFEGGYFSSDQFTVAFSDSGVLKQVSLNSDPQVDETLVAAAAVAEKVAAFAALDVKPDCGATKSELIETIKPLKVTN